MVWLFIFIDQRLGLSRRTTLVLVVHDAQRIDVQTATDGQTPDFENYMIHTQKYLASIMWRIPSFVCWWWGVGGREGGNTEWFS